MQEARELANDPSTDYTAAPLEDDIFEWHCTLRGSPGTEFEGGLYHVRILLPAEYPFRPPSLMVLTPNGRFELNTKVSYIHCHIVGSQLHLDLHQLYKLYVELLIIDVPCQFMSRSRRTLATGLGCENR